MPKKTKNAMDDNFSFDSGGMSEFFPLENPSKSEKPPKGAKGYLKNVAKSVVNLGVKVNKHLYPEVFELGESLGIGSENENRVNVKGILTDVNREMKKWSGIGKDVVKEVVKDTKQAVKTGYFVKTEDEAMDMSSMFGDMFGEDSGFDFGEDSVTFDGKDNFALDDSGFGLDDEGSSNGARLDFGEAIVKSEYASTKAILTSNAKMINSNLSATQSHIKNERLIFAQQMSVLQEHHDEKMGILKNIATNIGKNIEQGNISLRAQMEFSAKSLAFAQDTAAMVKEMRDAIWKMSKPEEKKNVDERSMFGKVFGSGSSLNLKEWIKYYKGNTKANAAGGLFDMLGSLPEMLETMTGMGMTPAQAIKSIAGGMITDSITDTFVNKDTRKKINAFNLGMRSLPGAINAKLGDLSNDPDKITNVISSIPLLGKFLDKKGLTGKIGGFLSAQAGYAHMTDNTTVLSDKYMMGDPDAVHPFDNKAHKVLTEVIPYQLSEINAGVNHKEAEYFDFKLNKFMPKSYMRTLTEQNERNVVKSNFGYSELENDFNTRLARFREQTEGLKNIEESDRLFYDSTGKLVDEMISSEFDRMLANWHRNQLPWNKESVNKIKKDEYYRDIILSGTTLELTSDNLKKIAVNLFADTIKDQLTITDKNGKVDYEKAERNRYLRAGGLSYAGDLTNMYSENEDRFAGMGSSIDYYSQMRSKDIKQEIRKAEFELTKAQKRYDDNHSAKNLERLQAAKKRVTELKQMSATTGYSNTVNENINSGFNVNDKSDFDFENFRLKSLEDSSQYGLIQNIYNLLLSGIDVYNKNEPSKDHLEFVKHAKHAQGENKRRSITSLNTFQKSTEYEPVGTGAEINERLKEDGKDEDGKVENWRMSDEYRFLYIHHFKFYEYDDKSGQYKPVSGTNFQTDKTYYRRVADINADYNMTSKEQKMERSESLSSNILQRIPGVRGVYNAFNNIYGKGTQFASKFLGENFFGEDYGNQSYKDDFDKAKTVLDERSRKIKNSATDKVESALETAKSNEYVGAILEKGDKLKDSIMGSKVVQGGKETVNKYKKAYKDGVIKDVFKDDFDKAKTVLDERRKKAVSEFNILKKKILNEKLSPLVKKELSNELINLRSKDGTKLGNVIDDIRNPYFVKRMEMTTDPVEKAKFLLAQASNYDSLVPFTEQLTTFAEKRKGSGNSIHRAIGFLVQRKVNVIKEKVDTKLKTFMDKSISKELMHIKSGDKELGDVLGPILETNSELQEKLNNASTASDKANILLRLDNPEIQEFKPKIREFAEKYANSRSAAEHGMNLALDKGSRLAKSAFDWLKHKLFDKADEEKKYKKYFDKELIEVFGGEESYIQNIEKGGITIEDIESLDTSDKSVIAEFLMQNGRYDRNIKRQLRVYMSIVNSDDKSIKDTFSEKVLGKDKKFFKQANRLLDKNERSIDKINREVTKDIPDTFRKRLKMCNDDYEEAIKSTVDFYKNYDEKEHPDWNKNTVDIESWIRENINTDSTMKESWKKSGKGKIESVSTKAKSGILRGIFKGKKEESEGDGIVNTSSEMKKDREDKKREGFMETMASNLAIMGAFFKKADKDGLDLSKKTTDKIDESNKEAAEITASSVGDSNNGMISSLLNKVTGGKFVDIVGKAGNVGGMLTKAGGSLAGAGGVLGKIGGLATKAGGLTSSAAAAAGKLGSKSVIGAAKAVGSVAGKSKGLIGKVGGLIGKLVSAIGKGAGSAAKAAGEKVKTGLLKGISKFAPKLGAKLGAVSAASATIMLEVAMIVAGFTKGMYKAKEYFKVGKGMRISFGMKMAAGLGEALDSGLMGIPGLIANFMGFPSVPIMFYEWCGGDAEKDALVRYKKFNGLRSRILGVADPDALVAWENRSQNEGIGGAIKNGLNRGVRAIGSFLTGGIMMSNDEKDASMLGFKHINIYKKWKAEKYDQIDQLRQSIAESFGGLKYVEDITSTIDAEDMDKDKDGQIDTDNEDAAKQIAALQNQAKYRTTFLKEAKKYVQENDLAWLTTSCTAEEFAKRTGKEAGEEIETSTGSRVKKGAKKLFTRALNATPIGLAISAAKAVKANGGLIATTKKIKEKVANLYKKYGFGKKEEDMHNEATATIQSVLSGVDPAFTESGKINNDNPEGTVGTSGAESNSDVVNVGQNGGPGFEAGEGYFVKTNAPKQGPIQKQQPKTKPEPRKPSTQLPSLADTYDLSGRTPKATVMNSIADDFAKNFGNELNKKLDILKEIQEENLRHHDVAENFFSAALQFLSQIAKNSGKTQISSKLDSMVREVTSM